MAKTKVIYEGYDPDCDHRWVLEWTDGIKKHLRCDRCALYIEKKI